MINYEDALAASLAYFNNDDLAAKVTVDKYLLRNNEGELLEKDPTDIHRRLAKEFARIEAKKFKTPLTEEEIFNLFDRYKYICCQGSPTFGIGNDYQIVSLSNCYVLESPVDSYGAILRADQHLIQISKRRGGVGVDLSNLRPKGASTKNAARNSTGIISWMERFSNSIREVGQDGRRGALMLTLNVTHPDIYDFISIKNDPTKVTGANISVRLNDKFMREVEANEEYTLQFPINDPNPTIVKKIKAKDLWEKMIECAWLRAEPGLIFWDRVTEYNAVDCYEKFKTESTNPCSELPLCPNDSCRLMFLNLLSYVTEPFTKNSHFDVELFEKHVKIAQRLMDDLIDLELEKINTIIEKINSDPELYSVKAEELELWYNIREKCENGRRTGLGVTAWGDTLAALGIKYGSQESIQAVEAIHEVMKLESFRSSMEMAKELGPFPIWDWETEKNSPFLLQILEEDEDLYENIKKYGRRNIANLTIAPVGSMSILTQTTSGIEPVFKLNYKRRKKINHNDTAKADFTDPSGDKWLEFVVDHPGLAKWKEVTGEEDIEKSPYWGCEAEQIDWTDRVKLQAAAQKHIDHSISSTINLPEDVTKEEVGKIYMEAWKSGCKGITVYRNNCRTGVLIDNKKDKIVKTNAPPRPSILPCKIFYPSYKKEKFFVVIGFLENCPYECFSGNYEKIHEFMNRDIKSGFIKRAKAGHYQLISDDNELLIEDVAGCSDDSQEIVNRLISTSLRHGADVKFVKAQILKCKGDLYSLGHVISRVLGRFVGEEVLKDKCPECENELVYSEGCVKCKNCPWSKC